jgi:hypothetical protein
MDVRKYAKIRIMAHEFAPSVAPNILVIGLRVKEGAVTIPLPSHFLTFPFPPGPTQDWVIEVPGRELEMFVHELVGAKHLHVFVFGLEL